MKIDLGMIGTVEMEELDKVEICPQGFIYHSGFTAQGIRVHTFLGKGWQHGCMWNNTLMLDLGEVSLWERE